MKRLYRLGFIAIFLSLAGILSVSAQQTSSSDSTQSGQNSSAASGFKAGLGLQIGAETFNEPALNGIGTIPVTWQSLALQPDFSFGKIGIGLDVKLHYRFTGGLDIYGQPTTKDFQIRSEDWVPTSFSDFFSLYLPKIAYVRYGEKGDPLYAKLGSIDNSTLGNGFIMGGYSNTLFLPETRIFGMNFDLDGKLFKFPYIGMQTVVGNLTKFDVLGASLYGRPLLGLNIPIIKNLQVSGIIAADTNPFLYSDPSVAGYSTNASVAVYGADLMVPILSNPIVSLASMGSVAFENSHPGGMVGVAGRLVKFITYGAQLRFLGNNFIPDYFGPTYDLYRADQYNVVNSSTVYPGSVAWFATGGFSLLADKLVFNVSVDGPFKPIPVTPTTNAADYPHLSAVFQLGQGVIPGLYFDASYDKKFITSFKDLVSASNAVIGASVNYKTGPAVITLTYDLKYNPVPDANGKYWTVNSGLSSSISLF